MAEPFSIVSASISLLDVSLRAIRETCKFISALRQASAELRYLHRHLAGLEKALIRSKTLKQSYSNSSLAPLHQSAFDDLDEELKLFVQDLARLKSLLGGPESSAEHAFNRFGKRVKSVFKEKELSKISGRLERRRLGISEILSSIGRHNDLETQVRLKAIQESQENLETDLKSNDTTTHLKLDAIVQTQRDTRRDQRQISQTLVQTVSSQTLSLSTITTRQEELKSTIVTGFSTACDHLSATRSDSTTSKGMIQQLSKHVSTNTDKLDRLAGLVESLNTLQLPSLGDQVIMNGSAQDAVTSLSLLSKHFEEIAAASLHQSPENVLPSSSGAGILVHNFRSLLAILHAQAYHEITSNKKQSNYAGRYRPSQPIALRKMLRNNPSYFRTIASVRNHKKRSKRREAVEIRETKISVDLGPIGRVTVFISENDPLLSNGSELGGFRVLFFPKAEVPVCGFAASFANNAPTPTMSPLLSTFGVLPPDHDIWRYIAGGHIDGVRDLLGDHRVHLNDRDNRDGDTLLGCAAYYHQVEIMQLLLIEGADTLDCDSNGSSALSIFYKRMTRKKQHGTRILDTTRSLTAAGGADVVECERHLDWDGTITGTFTQGIIHSAIQWLFRSWSSNDAITESCQSLELLLQRGADTEVRDGWGETPLLSATDYLCFSALPRVMRLLLKYGADTRAIDDDADGILHRISSPLTVCDVHGPGAAWYEEISEIIVSLLQMGCDPNSENAYGFTPSDRFMSPSSWTLWCECLEKAGLEVAQILQKDDKAYGVEWLENEIDEKYHTVVAEHEDVELPESKKLKEFATDGSSCQCCGSQRVWQSWQAPFDLYGSYLVDGSEGSLHSHIDYHSAGQPCTNWVKKHTCKHSEHNDNGFAPYPSARELSWRKHVAYRLWKNGLLGDAWGASDAWSMPTYL